MSDETIDIIRTVIKDGSTLGKISKRYQDDFVVCCAAVLARENGGSSVLEYASPRLKNEPIFWNVLVDAKRLDDIRKKIIDSPLSSKEKSSKLAEVEEKRIELLKKYSKEYNRQNKKNTNKSIINDSLKKILDQGILGSKISYTTGDFLDNLSTGIYLYLGSLVGRSDNQFKMIEQYSLIDFFSVEFPLYGVNIRQPISDYYNNLDNVLDVNSLLSLDILRLCLENENISIDKKEKIKVLLDSIDNNNNSLRLFNNINIDDIYILLRDYCNNLNLGEVFHNDNLVIEEVTKSARGVLSNIDSFSLLDSFSGSLLGGKIQVSSDRGYPNRSDIDQQDCVGSYVIDDNHFINIVADGVGGVDSGSIASRILVDEVINWYSRLGFDEANNIYSLSSKLENLIYLIDEKIYREYKGSALTTFVLSVTVGDETLILNIGDSTCYSYDKDSDKLVELSTLDSLSHGLSYEKARHNPDNNKITQAIGSMDSTIHMRVIDNMGQRIILSSDGVTDLISENNFKKYFKKSYVDAEDIVKKAKNRPDVSFHMKSEDNISVIVVDLPEKEYERRR